MIFRPSVPVILQSEAPECGIACVAMIASFHGLKTDLAGMRLRLVTSLKGVTLKQIGQMAEIMNLSARGVQLPLEAIGRLKLPAILHWDMNHFVVLTQVSRRHVIIHDPARGRRKLRLDEVSRHFTGVALELTPTPGFRKGDERERIGAGRLLAALSGQGGVIAQIFMLSLALEIFAIALPLFLQLVVDRVIVGRDVDFLTVLAVGFLALVVIQVMVTAVRAWASVFLSTHLNMRLLMELFAQLLRLPLSWFEKRHIGDIISRFRSVDAIQRTLTTTFVETVVDGLMVVLTLIVMSFYSRLLTGVVLIAAALYGLARWIVYGAQRRALDEQLAQEARTGTHFIETVRGMMALKLNLREDERRGAYQNLVVDQINAGVRVQRIGIAHRAANGLIFGVENVVIIWLAALAVMDGLLSVGMLYAFLGFKLVFLGRVNNLIDRIIDFRMLDLHAERIADIALADPENRQGSQPQLTAPLVLRARGIGYAYGSEGFVFRGVDCELRSGEFVALVGPSGCGKTTLIKVLVGLLSPTEGQIHINGHDLASMDVRVWRARIGVVMQDDQLFAGTLEDNISFFDPEHDAEHVRACARLAMIDEDIAAMPMQYNTLVGNLGVALSGGQKQRILLARALYRRPDILFLDEAFDQLDLEREHALTLGLRAAGLGVVLVSHRPDTVRQADRIIPMSLPA